MKRLFIVCVVLLLAEVAYGIADGPGGRVYITDFITVTADGVTSYYRRFWSLPIGTNWAAGTLELHGDIVDNSQLNTQASWTRHGGSWGGSPEILTSAADPNTGYATFIMGLLPNDTPESANPAADCRAMDVLKVTPTSGSIGYTSLGGGRSWVAFSTLNTDGGFFAMPDPSGNFTGDSNYIIASGMGGANNFSNSQGNGEKYKILRDYNNDTDFTDDDEDYVESNIARVWSEEDMELWDNRLFVSAGYATVTGSPGNFDGYFYIDRETGGGYSGVKPWFCTNPLGTVPATIPAESIGQVQAASGGMAVGWATDNEGVKHTALWATKVINNEIWLFVDYNDDGDAMDNGEVTAQPLLEYRKIYDAASAANPPNANNDTGSAHDIEFIDTPDGHFLMVLNASGNRLVILQLADNGEFMGTGMGAQAVDYVSVITGLPTGAVQEIEFDYGQFGEVIPEPATMLLVGTGLLGAVGYIRRRRMQ